MTVRFLLALDRTSHSVNWNLGDNMPQDNAYSPTLKRRSRGAATLLVTIMLLISATLIVFTASRTSITEQQISANEVRARTALEAAQVASDAATVYFAGEVTTNSPGRTGVDHNNDDQPDTIPVGIASASAAFCDPDDTAALACPQTPGAPTGCQALTADNFVRPIVAACGWSDDSAARHLITFQLEGTPAMPNAPGNAVTFRGSVGASGSFTVVNFFSNFTYWTGGDLEFGNATAKSFIRKPGSTMATDSNNPRDKSIQLANALGCGPLVQTGDEYYYDNCSAPTNSDTTHLIQTTDKSNTTNVIGADVLDKDYNLGALSQNDFFANFFGKSLTEYKNENANRVIDGTANDVSSQLTDAKSEVIWVDGTVTLPARMGSIDNPVVLIVNGDLNISANTEFYGLIYVNGEISGNGNPSIFGSIIVWGENNSLTGNAQVIYDEGVMNNIRRTIAGAKARPGTWRDWIG